MTRIVGFPPTPTPTPTAYHTTLIQHNPFFTPPVETAPEPLDLSMVEDVEMGYVWPDPSSCDDTENGSPLMPTPVLERTPPPMSEPTTSKALKFRMGFVPGCPKCRDRVPGHYSHF